MEILLWPGNRTSAHFDLCAFYLWVSLLCFPPCLRIFGGLILDIKRKAPFFWSDFRDAFSLQCLASFLFLYCACMSPVITFGGLLGEATEGRIVRIMLFSELWILVCFFFFKICSYVSENWNSGIGERFDTRSSKQTSYECTGCLVELLIWEENILETFILSLIQGYGLMPHPLI